MIEKVLQAKNLYKAYHRVVSNRGASGIDGMDVTELKSYIDRHQNDILISILNGKYIPSAIRGVAIPKSNGKTRLLGVPTVVDRWLQQAVSQKLATRFELDFEEESYGFRPGKNLHQAVKQSLTNIPVCRQAGMMVIKILWISTCKGSLMKYNTTNYFN
jgi:retron-type reverse transcriptase